MWWIAVIVIIIMIIVFTLMINILLIVSKNQSSYSNYYIYLNIDNKSLAKEILKKVNLGEKYIFLFKNIYIVNILNNLNYENEKYLETLTRIKASLNDIYKQQNKMLNYSDKNHSWEKKKIIKIINRHNKKIFYWYKKIILKLFKNQNDDVIKLLLSIIFEVNKQLDKVNINLNYGTEKDDYTYNLVIKKVWYSKYFVTYLEYLISNLYKIKKSL